MAFKPLPPADEAPHAKVAHTSWARSITKVFAADPLGCPDCGGTMRIVCAILEHLSLWDEPRPPPAKTAARHAEHIAVPQAPGDLLG